MGVHFDHVILVETGDEQPRKERREGGREREREGLAQEQPTQQTQQDVNTHLRASQPPLKIAPCNNRINGATTRSDLTSK